MSPSTTQENLSVGHFVNRDGAAVVRDEIRESLVDADDSPLVSSRWRLLHLAGYEF